MINLGKYYNFMVDVMSRVASRFSRWPSFVDEKVAYFYKSNDIVKYLYFFLLYQSIWTLLTGEFGSQKTGYSPLWVLYPWASYFTQGQATFIVNIFFVFTSLAASIFFYKRPARVLAFLGVFYFHGFESSFGFINHQWYQWLYVSLLLIFLPDFEGEDPSDKKKRGFVFVFWSIQFFLLLTYSMSGYGKLISSIPAIVSGDAHSFSIDAFALHIANWLPTLGETSLLGPFIVDNPLVGWPFYILSIYIQLFAVFVAFRPSLHRLWGIALIFFHLGTYIFMKISFPPPVMLIILILLNSPFADRGLNLKRAIIDLPVFGLLFRLLFKKFYRRT